MFIANSHSGSLSLNCIQMISFMKDFIFPDRNLNSYFEALPNSSEKWRELYGNDHIGVERFLTIFCESFGLAQRYSEKISPLHPINIIYDQIYKNTSKPDALEHVTLCLEIEKAYSITFPEIQVETVGQLYKISTSGHN